MLNSLIIDEIELEDVNNDGPQNNVRKKQNIQHLDIDEEDSDSIQLEDNLGNNINMNIQRLDINEDEEDIEVDQRNINLKDFDNETLKLILDNSILQYGKNHKNTKQIINEIMTRTFNQN